MAKKTSASFPPPPDVDVPHPDEKSIITYVSSLYDAMPRSDGHDGARVSVSGAASPFPAVFTPDLHLTPGSHTIGSVWSAQIRFNAKACDSSSISAAAALFHSFHIESQKSVRDRDVLCKSLH